MALHDRVEKGGGAEGDSTDDTGWEGGMNEPSETERERDLADARASIGPGLDLLLDLLADSADLADVCPVPGCGARLVGVKGHLECPRCHRVAEGCCEGGRPPGSCSGNRTEDWVASASLRRGDCPMVRFPRRRAASPIMAKEKAMSMSIGPFTISGSASNIILLYTSCHVLIGFVMGWSMRGLFVRKKETDRPGGVD
jgi:hypothetical protein